MSAADLIRNADGSIYHLHLHRDEIAEKVILVGDPRRVDQVASHFERVESTRQHREFRSITGWKEQQRLTVLSSGIGTDNIDIVWTELDALVNYDWEKQQFCSTLRKLKALRLGTCGGLHGDIPVGSLIHSRYAIGGDGLMSYYQPSGKLPAAVQALQATLGRLTSTLHPHPPRWYASQCDEDLDALLAERFPDILPGITFTAAGFYGPQGRDLGRVPLGMPELIPGLREVAFDGLRVLNLEMETAAIMALGRALGHQSGAISVVLAQRAQNAFHPEPSAAVDHLIEQGLAVMLAWEVSA
jgi:uridine phosphorylase